MAVESMYVCRLIDTRGGRTKWTDTRGDGRNGQIQYQIVDPPETEVSQDPDAAVQISWFSLKGIKAVIFCEFKHVCNFDWRAGNGCRSDVWNPSKA